MKDAMSTKLALPFIILLVAMFISACGGGGAGGGGGVSTEVNVTLGEWYLDIDKTTVPAGNVTFIAENVGNVEHELVVLKTDLHFEELIMNRGLALGQGSEVVEEESGTVMGRIPEEDHENCKTFNCQEVLFPRDTETGTFNLTPGNYVVMCNRPMHYENLQKVAFVVE